MSSKMFVILPAMLLMGQLDLTNPFNVFLLRVAFFSVQAIFLLLAGYMFYLIKFRNDQKKILVPAAAAPSWMSSEPAPPPTETICDYDVGELRKFVTQILLGLAICSFIHFKFEIAQPLFIQTIMAPFTLYECALFKIHMLGLSEAKDSSLKRPFTSKDQNPFAAMFGQQEQEPPAQEAGENREENSEGDKKKSKKERRKNRVEGSEEATKEAEERETKKSK